MWLVLVQGYPFGFKAGEKEMWRGKWVGKTNPNCSKMVVTKMVSYHPTCITSLSKKHTFELIIGWKHFCSLPCSQAWHVTKFWTMRYKWKMMWNFLEDCRKKTNSLRKYALDLFPFLLPAFWAAAKRAGVPAAILDQEMTLRTKAIHRTVE